MGYVLKLWTYTEQDGWMVEYNPQPETLEDARSLANWWIQHRPELRIEVQIIEYGKTVKIVDIVETDELGNIIVKGGTSL